MEKKPELIGEGVEKKVYPHPHKPEQVVGVYKEGKEEFKNTSEYIKGKFYLTKILHLLFPVNIPDIAQISSQPKTITRQKIALDELHLGLSQTDDLEHRDASRIKMRGVIDRDPRAQSFMQGLLRLGIHIDRATKNFSLDTSGNIIYLDDVPPWNDERMRWYDQVKLQGAIEERLQGTDKDLALVCLERLELLHAESATL